jgi:hypothetical protein
MKCQVLRGQNRAQQSCPADGPRTLPVLRIGCVYHLGTLNLTERCTSGQSLEGNAVSVSTVPHAWQQIARLGGRPLLELMSADGQFVDVLKLLESECLRDDLQCWAESQGLLVVTQRFRAWFYDSEVEDWRYLVLDTREEAWAEVDGSYLLGEFEEPAKAPAPPGHTCIEPLNQWVGTRALEEAVGRKGLASVDATDMALLVFVDRRCPQIDGLWWLEAYEPIALSAPRGGILSSRLERWAVTAASLDLVADEVVEPVLLDVDVRPDNCKEHRQS